MDSNQNNSDLIELLSSLVESKVKFLIVGGHAVAKYGEPRYTKDVDIWIECSEANAKKVYSVLQNFGAPVDSVTYKFFTFEDHFLKIGREPLRVDIICGMQGLAFSAAWPRRNRGSLFGVRVWFVSLDDLLTLKNLANRPQDLLDVAMLKKHSGKKTKV